MRTLRILAVVSIAAAIATVARGGHELPVYPSYYPHEIELKTAAPEPAAELLLAGKMHAYVGDTPHFPNGPPEWMRAVESLGVLVTVRINPASSVAIDKASACAV